MASKNSSDSTAQYRRNDKVRAVEPLPGVPSGTEGLVLMKTGLRWPRYFVQFANGRSLGQIDGSKLEQLS